MKHAMSLLVIGRDAEQLRAWARPMIAGFNPADVFWLGVDEGEQSIKVKETLEFMDRAYLAPVGEGKLLIICDAALMTHEAQNKILKTVEDAPAGTTFLLLSTSAEAIFNTVKSRCRSVFLPQETGSRVVPEGVVATLRNIFNVEFDEKTLNSGERCAILDAAARVNRNVAANCNQQNTQDILIMEILKNAKNR